MSLPRISPDGHVLLSPEPFTPAGFAEFGTAVVASLPWNLNRVPESAPEAEHSGYQPPPQFANQKTALKTSPISPLINNYPDPDISIGRGEAKGLMSIFSCFPRDNLYHSEDGKLRIKVEIVERHPFTTQTFCPFNFSDPSGTGPKKTFFLVVVAPTVQAPDATPPNPPDLSKMRAFLIPVTLDGGPGVAVTYNVGTWHAPMIVLGDRRVDFLVSQFANGNGPDDCQEVLVGDEEGSDRTVEVDLERLQVSGEYGKKATKAKL